MARLLLLTSAIAVANSTKANTNHFIIVTIGFKQSEAVVKIEKNL